MAKIVRKYDKLEDFVPGMPILFFNPRVDAIKAGSI
ncbi:hypothetical protein HRbin37_00957 [bacterium HR37]|nr:hypothetical protein HRbin37_00957 [bacterium HR37]